MGDSCTPKHSFPQHGLQDIEQLDLLYSVESLKDQVAATIVPQQLEKIKDLLLSIIQGLLSAPRKIRKMEDLYFFVTRVVERSMNVLVLPEATEAVTPTIHERLLQLLENAHILVGSVTRRKAYPRLVNALLTVKHQHADEKKMTTIIDGITALLSNQTDTVPRDGSSDQLNIQARSTAFSNARNFSVNSSPFYHVYGGPVQIVTHQVNQTQNEGNPDFLGLPSFDNLELEMELYQGREYHIHRGRASGRAIAAKVFHGPRAKQLCLKTAKFNHGLMHPNVLQMIGGPDRNLGSPVLVFEGDYLGTVESHLAAALKEGIKEGCVVGVNTVIACSLGLDYLQKWDLPFPTIGPQHFVLLVSTQGKISLSLDAEQTWEAPSTNEFDQSTSNSDQATKICHELIQKTFYSSCKEHYQDRRMYTDDDHESTKAFPENRDKVEGENEGRLPGFDAGGVGRGSTSWTPMKDAKENRRELVWKPHLTVSKSLGEIGRHYQAFLARFRSDPLLVHRLGPSLRQTAHRCPGYKRTEIILTPGIKESRIVSVSHMFPVPNEICSVCGEKVGKKEIFNCSCGLSNSDMGDFLPTIKCMVCSHWQHRTCMEIKTDTVKNHICWRCPGSTVMFSQAASAPIPSVNGAPLALPPPGHLNRSPSPNDLAISLITRDTVSGHIRDLEESIALYRDALILSPPGHPDRSTPLGSLAGALYKLYEKAGNIDDLKESLALNRDALILRPPGHPDRSVSLYGLALALHKLYEKTGKIEDLEESIVLYRDALILRPPGHPDHSTTLNNLALTLYNLYGKTGNIYDLEESIALNRATLTLCPPGHPDRSVSLNNLALALNYLYQKTGHTQDLEESVSLYRDALLLRPPGHPRRSILLNNLAITLYNLYGKTGQIENLEESIALNRDTLVLCPPGHPDRSISFNNLALALSSRYQKTGRTQDLEESISLSRDALNLRPPGHPHRSMLLNNLADALKARGNNLGNVERSSISYSAQSLPSMPP